MAYQTEGIALMLGFQSLRDELPFDFYEELRAAGRPVWDEGMRGWLVVSHSGCRLIEMMEETHFTPPWYDTPPEVVRVARGSERALAAVRGDHHRAQHMHVVRLLMPSNLSKVVGRDVSEIMCQVAEAELAPMVAAGGGDIASGWLDRLPLRLFLQLVDLELAPGDFEACWSDIKALHRLNEFFDQDATVMRESLDAAEAWNARLLPAIRAREASQNRGQDVISYLWETGPTLYEDWNERDVLAACRALFGAGTMTTNHVLSNMLYLLASDPVLQEDLRARDELIPAFVEEALRLQPPNHYRPRRAQQEVDIDGQPVQPGETVYAVMAAANRDPELYERPSELDLTRKSSSGLHSFYRGRRACGGASLARAEAADIVAVLLRTVRVELDNDAPPPALMGHMFRAYRPLPVTLEAIHAEGNPGA
jgi:cytochrome P450